MSSYTTADEATILIIESQYKTIIRELGTRTIRSIQSPSASLYNDLGTSIIDAKERIIAVGGWLAGIDSTTDIVLKNVLNFIGRESLSPGDFIISNDPFIMKGGHLPDWFFLLPVFYKDKLVSYLTLITHQYDTGGAFPGAYAPRGYDAHSEGIIIPPTKIFSGGVENKDVYALILNNVRGRQMVRWDNMLIRGAMIKASERITELFDRYGLEIVEQAFDQIIERPERSVRNIIKKWPAKEYQAARAADWDGTRDEPVWVRLKLTVKPDEGQLIFDYSESDTDRDFINTAIGLTTGCTRAVVAQCLPLEIANNQGLYNCITVTSKEGTVCNVKYPSTSGGAAVTINNVIDAVQYAMAQIVPEDVSACWTKHIQPIPYGKIRNQIDPRTGTIRYYRLSPMTSDGGAGAIWGYDGWDGVGFNGGGGRFIRAPIEIVEHQTPYRYLCCEWITDSAGDGQFRGSVGTYVEYLNEMDPTVFVPGDAGIQTGNSDGEKFEGFGLLGGKSGTKNEMYINKKGKLIPLKCEDNVNVEPGDIIITKSGGGGGVGNPLDRDLEKVQMDALNRYISIKKAKEVYGVIIDPDTFEVDYKASKTLRAKMKKGMEK